MKKLMSILAVVIISAVITACPGGDKPAENTSNAKTPEANKTTANNSSTNSSSTSNNSSTTNSSTTTSTSGDLAGTYSLNGTGLDGKAYQGELVVTNRDSVYQLSWDAGGSTYDGVGVQSGNTVAAAYTTGADGKGCGAVVYKIGADNSLDGKWGEWGVNQSGTEKATPVGELKGDTGTFDVTGTNTNGTAYKGKLTITKSGNDVYQFSWDVGSKYIGTGIKMGGYLAAGSGTKQCGFVIYEVKGSNLEGKWGVPGTTQLGTEKAVKK